MLDKIDQLSSKAFDELNGISSQSELEAWRVRHLGRKSPLVQTLRSLAALSIEEKRVVGARASQVKSALEKSADEKLASLERSLSQLPSDEIIDITLPGKKIPLGRLHPTSQILDEICDPLRKLRRFNHSWLESPPLHTSLGAKA